MHVAFEYCTILCCQYHNFVAIINVQNICLHLNTSREDTHIAMHCKTHQQPLNRITYIYLLPNRLSYVAYIEMLYFSGC